MDVDLMRRSQAPALDHASVERRAAIHRALGDATRLRLVDALALSDHTPSELAGRVGLGSNLVAFHLDVLEDAGVVQRSVSEGDRRRRYVRLRPEVLRDAGPHLGVVADRVLFVCTANSARSQLAAALWEHTTGLPGWSAGHQPAHQVHPAAVEVARDHGLDLSGRRPLGYGEVEVTPDLVVSVCDRAREAGPPFDTPTLHWSVPDPVAGGRSAVDAAYEELAARISWLAAARAVPGAPDEPDRTNHHPPEGDTVTVTPATGTADDSSTPHVPTVLFLCVHNAGRSQMAAGFLQHLGGEEVRVLSGGSEPASEVNPAAVAAMEEVGVDITSGRPRRWSDDDVVTADVVVTMGCGDTCPVLPGKRYLDWDLADPAGRGVDAVRPIRDDIEARVRELMDELGVPARER